ncbi:uncharacterized protein LOC116729094 isoform X1 [Xiphophorus hellerii]|uniref:uncharacterized protein LOC116729094 isoform X1 n=1 Tax=Xiphophorus hellerii TaxID=8084 RepID=UPI0013B477A8|nr:uncharacterized protein LOC116729094 isoform X1 [Xiphophorus hellerii]XP_032433322.1 uncharacterized protein LOC116729094 isoform X1 [Xiphophorus hellerii]
MFCFICKKYHTNANSLTKHLKVIHGLCSGKTLRLKCGQGGCAQVYGTFSGFRKHLNKAHDKHTSNHGEGPSTTEETFESQDLPSMSAASDTVLLQKSLVHSCATTVAELKVAGVSERAINYLVISLEEIVNDIQNQAKESVKNSLSLQEPVKSDIECKIDQCFEKMENPFMALNSESKRTRFLAENWGRVDPVECVLGSRFDTLRSRTTGGYDQVVVTDKFVYIPILETLKFIFRHPNIEEMMAKSNSSETLKDLSDGELFKSHALFSKQNHALQIQLFYDDFETANPLGSKRGIHKLGAVYFTLQNFSPKYNSALHNIHLVSLFHAQDIKTYGFSKILDPIVEDVKILERDGITVPLYDEPVRGTIVQVTGDNLGLHCLFGFVESFSARYCCRFCLVEKEDFQTEFTEDSPKIVMRTQALHAEHCQKMEANPRLPYVMGVKKSCILNSLQYFSTCENFSVDIMHDILEGVAQYEMKLILLHVIDQYTTLKDVDRRIRSFNYGYMEQTTYSEVVRGLK